MAFQCIRCDVGFDTILLVEAHVTTCQGVFGIAGIPGAAIYYCIRCRMVSIDLRTAVRHSFCCRHLRAGEGGDHPLGLVAYSVSNRADAIEWLLRRGAGLLELATDAFIALWGFRRAYQGEH